ncbi:uncharacterized protein PHALS_03750 [Plasmopara halstedii]|uniref:Uncharacterized protein n=1 Tax=Plasmopara halstedii TaxID=4781 RepID=A0A0P1AZ17_PLAHL|nr:uncharacterized protein PHALS_03750 [Plasmopara halstedii]CEG47095.1 hypothetical protein PHALS_03750 [Plasmopara halstedii]|eukprot:XP_024583464.1 hypothetical protein PHALS_03750 [Plasmopara halstedii]
MNGESRHTFTTSKYQKIQLRQKCHTVTLRVDQPDSLNYFVQPHKRNARCTVHLAFKLSYVLMVLFPKQSTQIFTTVANPAEIGTPEDWWPAESGKALASMRLIP